jgi:uncharacterized NAD(P)/FAD-binding protein YdhS
LSEARQFPHRSLAVVGVGPRGTSVLERICASVPELAPDVPLTVHLIDPAPPGAGRVWRTDQPAELLMNTVASQVTVFTDASVTCEGPICPGPSLYEWAASRPGERIGPDDYPSRASYGRYLEWAFRTTVEGAPENVTVEVHRACAIRLDDDADGADTDPAAARSGSPTACGAPGPPAVPVVSPGVSPGAHSVSSVSAGSAEASCGVPEVHNVKLNAHTVEPAAHPVVPRAHPVAPGECAVGRPTQTLTLDDGTKISGLCAVVLAQGHLPVVPGRVQAAFGEYAARHRLRYVPPANPADVDLSGIAPEEPVLLRGLGLNFFDHMTLLTVGRGGVFARDPEGVLVYHPTGREPRLYAGSRRGVPYQARGDNAKGPSGRHQPLVLTPDVIASFRKRADGGDPPDFRQEIWPLVAKEVEAVYYEALLAGAEAPDSAEVPAAVRTGPGGPEAGGPGPDRTGADGTQRARTQGVRTGADRTQADRTGQDRTGAGPRRDGRWTGRAGFVLDRFLATPHGGPREAAVLDEAGIPAADRWCWDRISRPYGDEVFRDPADHRAWLLAHLRRDAAQAALGNLVSPVKAALDVLRDLRNELRQIVDHAGLSGTSRREHLDRWYTPLNAFLSIGPPRHRVEEMAALIEAGVLDVIGPRTTVRAQNGAFLAESPDIPGSAVRATTLVEARLPVPDLRHSCDPLLSRLLKTGQCRPHRLDGYDTGGLDVTPRPYRLVDRQGQVHPRRFAFGVPTEGVHWVTAAGARPGVDSVMLSDTDAVARAVLRTPAAGAAPEGEKRGQRATVAV